MDDFPDIIFAIALIFIVAFILGLVAGNSAGYRKGQINAINGIIEYKLVVHENKTVTWEKIKCNS